MKKKFKVEAIYDGRTIWYAVYQKRFLWGWKYLGKSVYESYARKIVEELANPPTYIETKKIIAKRFGYIKNYSYLCISKMREIQV